MSYVFREYVILKPLVALIGSEAVESIVKDLERHATPSPVIAAFPSVSDFAQYSSGATGQKAAQSNVGGILPANWLHKHQHLRPSVACILFSLQQAMGDPTAWALTASQLNALKATIKPRAVRIVVGIIVSDNTTAQLLTSDRIGMIARQVGIERSAVVAWHAENRQQLVDVISQESAAFYAADAQSRLQKYSHENAMLLLDMRLRAAFKLACLAEQRGDWAGAVALLQEAYNYVPQALHSDLPLQKYIELRSIAAVLNYRLMALLIRALEQYGEMASQFDQHRRIFRHLPPKLAHFKGIVVNHQRWIATQLVSIAELLESVPVGNALPVRLRPTQLYILAAGQGSDEVVFQGLQPGMYIGQLCSMDGEPVGDEEIVKASEAVEKKMAGRDFRIQSLQKASTFVTGSHALKKGAMLKAQIHFMLAEAYLAAARPRDATEAAQIAAQLYRKHGCSRPLLQLLNIIQECNNTWGDMKTASLAGLEASMHSGNVQSAQKALDTLKGSTYNVFTVQDTWAQILSISAGLKKGTIRCILSNFTPIDIMVTKALLSFDNGEDVECEGVGKLQSHGQLSLNAILPTSTQESIKAVALTLSLAPSDITLIFKLPDTLQFQNDLPRDVHWGVEGSGIAASVVSTAEVSIVAWLPSGGILVDELVAIPVIIQGLTQAMVADNSCYLDVESSTLWVGPNSDNKGSSLPSLPITSIDASTVIYLRANAAGEHVIDLALRVGIEWSVTMASLTLHTHASLPIQLDVKIRPQTPGCLLLSNSADGDLPVNQDCISTVTIYSLAPMPLEIAGMAWRSASDQLSAAPLLKEGGGSMCTLEGPGSSCSRAFTVKSAYPLDLESMGTLEVSWKRASLPPMVVHSSEETAAARDHVCPSEPSVVQKQLNVSKLALPAATFVAAPVLLATPRFVDNATSGNLVQLKIDIQCVPSIGRIREISISVGDTHGFMVAGPRNVTLPVVDAAVSVEFSLVPYHVGFLTLPEVWVGKKDDSCRVLSTAGCVMSALDSLCSMTGNSHIGCSLQSANLRRGPRIFVSGLEQRSAYSNEAIDAPRILKKNQLDPSTHQRAYVGGDFIDAASKKTFEVINPATGHPIARVADCGAEDAKKAIQVAAEAFPKWSERTAKERSIILHRWADELKSNRDNITQLMTLECGKPLAEARNEFDSGVESVAFMAEECRRTTGDVLQTPASNKRFMVLRQPVGVVAAITPWNFPFSMITRKLSPALAAGCPVILKPATETPLTALAMAALAERAGIPRGVFNVLPNSNPSEVGDALLESPLVRKFGFTGSTPVGKQLYAKSAATVKKLSLELGGNAPFIVFEDADIDKAARDVVMSSYRNAGQTCICTNRVLVHAAVADQFTQAVVQRAKALRVGFGLENGVTMGPLITHKAVDRVEEKIKEAKKSGANVVLGGRRSKLPGVFKGGYFFDPTVLTDVTTDMRIYSEETFGPVTPIVTFERDEDAIKAANDTPYGLAAYFYTRDVRRSWRVAEQLEYGMVGVNEVAVTSEVAPFGGWKESGLGVENGVYGLHEFLNLKTVCLAV